MGTQKKCLRGYHSHLIKQFGGFHSILFYQILTSCHWILLRIPARWIIRTALFRKRETKKDVTSSLLNTCRVIDEDHLMQNMPGYLFKCSH